MKSPDMQELLSKAVKGTLNAAEQVRWQRLLASDPELRTAFEEELALEQVLDQLPDAPISSNFTALVLQAAQRESKPGPRSAQPRWRPPRLWFHPIIARAIGLAVVIVGVGLSLGHYRNVKRAEMASNVRSFSEVASVIGSPKTAPQELFQNFEAIRRLSLPADADVDMELLIALQK